MMQVIKRPEGEKASVRTYHGSYCQVSYNSDKRLVVRIHEGERGGDIL